MSRVDMKKDHQFHPTFWQTLFPIKLDEHIRLLPLRASDAEQFLLFVKRDRAYLEEFDPYLKPIRTLQDARKMLGELEELCEQDRSLTCGIWDDDTLVGFVNAGIRPDQTLKLGYGLAADHQGRGIVTRACRVLIDYAFRQLNLKYAWLTSWKTNASSIAVAERLGFVADANLLPADPAQGTMTERYLYRLPNPNAKD